MWHGTKPLRCGVSIVIAILVPLVRFQDVNAAMPWRQTRSLPLVRNARRPAVPVFHSGASSLCRGPRGGCTRTSLLATPQGVAAVGLHIPRVTLLVLFIIVDSGQALVMDWAEKRSWMERAGRQYARQTALVVESGLSVATGLVVSLFLGANQLDQLALAFWPLCLRFFPVALCFAVGLSLKMMAVNHFQAGTIKIVGQLRLGLVAIASTILLARRYSPEQWVAISAVTVFCMLFVQVKGQGRKRRGKEWKWAGLSQLLGWVCMNVVGGTLAEKTYKSSDVPYYVQKVAQDMGHLATSLVMLFLVVPHFNPSEDIRNRSVRPDGFFDSWDVRTCFVVGFLFLDAWISNLLLKEFSGVTRGVAKAAGVAIVYFASLLYSKDRRANPKLTWIAIGVILGSLGFSIVS